MGINLHGTQYEKACTGEIITSASFFYLNQIKKEADQNLVFSQPPTELFTRPSHFPITI